MDGGPNARCPHSYAIRSPMPTSVFPKFHSSLSTQAKRLVAMRFLIYTGFQTSYFIGVIGTLTYADGASVVATSLAVLFMNVFVILGSFAGGAELDAWGPRRHFLLSIIGALATGTAIIAFGSATGVVLLGAVFLGFTMGFAQPIATSYPAYLTDDPVELKDINSAIAMFSNVSIIVGPMLGGFVAAAASSRAVFVLMMLSTVLAFVVGWGFRPQTSHVAGDADADSAEEGERAGRSSNPSTSARATFAASIKTVFTNSVLALLFCIIFLSNFGYGAFDPLESFFYRDVLRVGVGWMGWLSSASGVGAVLGAVVALRLPPHLVNLKTLLVALMSVGLGSLLYVGTPYVGVALVGQIALGIAWGVVNPLHNTIVQTTAPLEQLGRVNSVMGFGNMFAGVAPLAIAPWLAATFGVQRTLVGAGMVVTAVPAALLLFGRRHLDRAAKQ
ncbi:MFS transporter [Collinsella sp. AM18-10]|nr:MFS transporter [Collinsella sp. AM18-10]